MFSTGIQNYSNGLDSILKNVFLYRSNNVIYYDLILNAYLILDHMYSSVHKYTSIFSIRI